MKKSALTIAISSLLLASGAHAATVYNQNDTKLEIASWKSAAVHKVLTTVLTTTVPKVTRATSVCTLLARPRLLPR